MNKILEAVVTDMVDNGTPDTEIVDQVMNSRGVPLKVREAVVKLLKQEGY